MSGVSQAKARRRPGARPMLIVAAAAGCAAAMAVFKGAGSKAFVPGGLAAGPSAPLIFSASARSSLDQAAGLTARRAYTTMAIAEPPEDIMSSKMRKFTPSAEHLSYAIVEYNKRQNMLVEGGMYETIFMRALPGAKVRLNRVLLLKRRDRESKEFKATIGQPFIDGAYIEITILEHLKSEEREIYRHRARQHYQRRWIYQRRLTRFRVDKIVWDSPDAPVEGIRPFPLHSPYNRLGL
mmetsp:Transcript_118105/g.376559  ORF Transcript_118105/g.376559 Transcript_118105/m.376559 type:complete len:238 (-) Transcript_118105:271-984(-)